MVLDLRLGHFIRMKKAHPCGNDIWEVTRLGADISLKCLRCNRSIMVPRPYVEKKAKEIIDFRDARG